MHVLVVRELDVVIHDPDGTYTFHVNKRLYEARKLLLFISELGIPIATDFHDLIISQYINDLTCWGAITQMTESQVHREMVSGLGVPVGFLTATWADLQSSIDACTWAMEPQSYLGISAQGIASVLRSAGNADWHVILRSLRPQHVAAAAAQMRIANLPPCLVIDCCHAVHSQKKLKNLDKDFFQTVVTQSKV